MVSLQEAKVQRETEAQRAAMRLESLAGRLEGFTANLEERLGPVLNSFSNRATALVRSDEPNVKAPQLPPLFNHLQDNLARVERVADHLLDIFERLEV
jgi:hypothetical protein